MAKFLLSPELNLDGTRDAEFFCPGCKERHKIKVGGKSWRFNWDINEPTLYGDSVLVTGSSRTNEVLQCHSFIMNGFIQFLSDCNHELKNQIVELPKLIES